MDSISDVHALKITFYVLPTARFKNAVPAILA